MLYQAALISTCSAGEKFTTGPRIALIGAEERILARYRASALT
jgi:hypothetical protein